MKVFILDSGIYVGQAKNVVSGKFDKKNKHLFWSLDYVTRVIQIKISIFQISALINFKSSRGPSNTTLQIYRS